MDNINQLDKELAELKSFIADLKADRAAQKERERREAWTKYTSLSLVFIAVLATVATQYLGRYGGTVLVELNNSTFNQALASDEWSYYQAKSIKQNLYEALRELGPKAAEAGDEKAAQSVAAFNAKAAKYEAEKAEILKQAKQLEAVRDTARAAAAKASEHGRQMGTAVSVFQIAIALGSICLVTKKRPLWYLSLSFTALATVKMLMVCLR
jgi:Domain of unknown function (DUF4337)